MRTVEFNGEYWYVNEQPLLKRARKWLIWIGGWEKANGEGWHIFMRHLDTGKRALRDPTPVSLFGHRFTHYGWGWNVVVSGGYLVYSKRCSHTGKPSLYLSLDGTPGNATMWLFGAPDVVERAAKAKRPCEDYPRRTA